MRIQARKKEEQKRDRKKQTDIYIYAVLNYFKRSDFIIKRISGKQFKCLNIFQAGREFFSCNLVIRFDGNQDWIKFLKFVLLSLVHHLAGKEQKINKNIFPLLLIFELVSGLKRLNQLTQVMEKRISK